MSTKGQRHSLTFDSGLSYCDNFKHLLKNTGPFVTEIHVELPWAERTNTCISTNGPCHVTNMAAKAKR